MLSIVKRFDPGCVVYIRTGGYRAGTALAETLGVPCFSVDIRYPYSRWMDHCPPGLRVVTFLFKELLYRVTTPTLLSASLSTDIPAPLILVDDRASSGKTLHCALALLSQKGIHRSRILVAVERCGRRASPLVDVILRPDSRPHGLKWMGKKRRND